MNLIKGKAALPNDCPGAHYRCMTCGEQNVAVPTPAVAKRMRDAHRAQFPEHDARAWFVLPPVELP